MTTKIIVAGKNAVAKKAGDKQETKTKWPVGRRQQLQPKGVEELAADKDKQAAGGKTKTNPTFMGNRDDHTKDEYVPNFDDEDDDKDGSLNDNCTRCGKKIKVMRGAKKAATA